MSPFVHVTVTELTETALTVALPNGGTLTWERDPALGELAVGQQLVLTLTNEHNILNALLTDTDAQEPQS